MLGSIARQRQSQTCSSKRRDQVLNVFRARHRTLFAMSTCLLYIECCSQHGPFSTLDTNDGRTERATPSLSVCLSVCLLACLPVYLFACVSACLLTYLPTCLPACQVCLLACLPDYMPAYLSTCLPVCLLVCLPVCLSACRPIYLSACLPASFLERKKSIAAFWGTKNQSTQKIEKDI